MRTKWWSTATVFVGPGISTRIDPMSRSSQAGDHLLLHLETLSTSCVLNIGADRLCEVGSEQHKSRTSRTSRPRSI